MEIVNHDLGLRFCIDDDKVLVWDKRVDKVTGNECVLVKLVTGALLNISPSTMTVSVVL